MTVDVRRQLLRQVLYEPAEVQAAKMTLLPILDAVTPLAQTNEGYAKTMQEPSGNASQV